MRGRIKVYVADRGFGFIHPFDGRMDLFFHVSAFRGQHPPQCGQVVTFEAEDSPRGERAAWVIPDEPEGVPAAA